MHQSGFTPNAAVAIGAGAVAAVIYALLVAHARRHANRRATTLFFGETRLNTGDSTRSLFATWMSVGNVIVGALIIAITYRLFAAWAVLTWVIGFLILARHSPAILARANVDLTLHGFLRKSYGSLALSRITSIFALVTAAGVVALELIVGAALVRAIGLPISPLAELLLVVLVLAVLVLAYTRWGGLSAVIATDRVQAVGIGMALIALCVIAALGPATPDGPTVSTLTEEMVLGDPAWTQIVNLMAFFLGFGAFQLFLLLGDMTTWQRLQLGETPASARRAARSAGIANLFAWSILLFAGLALLSWPADVLRLPAVGGGVTETLVTQAEPLTSMLWTAAVGDINAPLAISVALVAVVVFGLFCAILSTTDSFLLIGVQAYLFGWTREGIRIADRQDLAEPSTDARIGAQARRLFPLLMAAALAIFALVIVAGIPLVAVIFFVFAAQCSIAPLAIVALYAPKACLGAARTASLSLIGVAVAIGVLFVLSGTTSSLSLSYAFSYLAPVAAIGIPILAFAVRALASGDSSLLRVGAWMICPPRKAGVPK